MNNFMAYFDGSDASVPVWIMILVSFLLGLIFKSLGCARSGEVSGLDDADVTRTGADASGTSGLATEKAEISAAGASSSSGVNDNLQVIEGIGPKVEGVLNDGSIETYRRLGESSTDELRGILDNAGPAFKVINPDSWPEQGRLAEKGQWEELKEYQEYLIGGVDPAKSTGTGAASDTIPPAMASSDVEELKTGTTVEAAKAKHSIKPGNLKIVEGIGPKIEELFHQAGVATLRDLADADVDDLRQILRDAGSRFQMHDPSTWPEQAGLAAEGKMDELKKYQDLLQGGKT